MIKKVVKISSFQEYDDEVELSWYDMRKPNLSAVSKKGINFITKCAFKHLHLDDVLLCEDGYKICVKVAKDNMFAFVCDDPLEFARIAYEIGNRHQPISIEKGKITVLDDVAIADIVQLYTNSTIVEVHKIQGYFKPNAKANHTH